MKSFLGFFAKRHLLANLVTLMTILLGLYSLNNIRREIWPSVNYGITVITTRYPGASPEDVELNVTNKIEDELKTVTGLDKIYSVSMENISVITIILDPDVSDQNEIMTDIREAVGRVSDFPVEVTESPDLTEIDTEIFAIIEVGLVGDVPYTELRETAKQFEKKLEAISGVSSINKFGYLAREIEVEVSPDAINNYQIPIREILSAIKRRNIRATGGSFESYTSDKSLVTLAQFKDPVEVGDVIVRSSFDGPLIKVKDLAVVKDDFEDERVLTRMNGHPAISFQIVKKQNADVIRTVEAIKNMVDEETEFLPDGISIQYSNDFSKRVINRFDVVMANGSIGLILVLIVLSIFLPLRSAFWVAMGIPITLFGVIYLMPVFDVFLDSISLAAMIIVIGIIVDDGIIIAENIHRHRERGATPFDAAVNGMSEVFQPVITTILTTFMAFAPMFFMTGIMGSFVFVIPLVISLALFVSMMEATVALPAHLTAGKKTVKKSNRTAWFKKLEKPFHSMLKIALKLRYLFLFLSTAIMVASFWYAANFMKFELFPASMADRFFMLVELPTGTSLEATSHKMQELEQLIHDLPENELESFVTRIGTQEAFPGGGFPPGENENWALMIVSLTPFNDRDRTVEEVVEVIREQSGKLDSFEKISFSIDAGGPPVGKPITLRVVGSDDTMRMKLVDSIVTYLEQMNGIKDIVREDRFGKDQVEIKIDYSKLARLGLTVDDVAQNVRVSYDGEVVTSVRYGDEDIDFRVLLEEDIRKQPNYLKKLKVSNDRGRLIPLSEFAKLETGPGPSNFFHYEGERSVTITADIAKGTTTPIEATTKITNHFNVSRDWAGTQLLVGGEAEQTAESMESLGQAFILAIIGVIFLLMLLFNSKSQPLMVMSVVPFGVMGVIIAFALHSTPFGFVAMLGIIGLIGVLVNDSLVLVVHINRLKAESPDVTLLNIVSQGTTDRLRAVILTTLTTVFGLLPLAYGIGGADPYMAPMAMALSYGLLFATPVTLVLIPSIYMVGSDIGRLFSRKK